jgi:hypothetical protein
MRTMRATRYGCDLAGVLQTHPDPGPAWPLTYGHSAALLRGYDPGVRAGLAWLSTTSYPLRSSLRRTVRRRLTLVGGVSWGLDPWARRLAGSPHLTSSSGTDWGEFPAGGRDQGQTIQGEAQGSDQGPRTKETKDQGLYHNNRFLGDHMPGGGIDLRASGCALCVCLPLTLLYSYSRWIDRDLATSNRDYPVPYHLHHILSYLFLLISS